MQSPLIIFLVLFVAFLVLVEAIGQVILHGITIVNYFLAKRDRHNIDRFVNQMQEVLA
jgi:Flp pilus assembly protein TadB